MMHELGICACAQTDAPQALSNRISGAWRVRKLPVPYSRMTAEQRRGYKESLQARRDSFTRPPFDLEALDPAFGHWFAGLTDGEGCFWVHRPSTSWMVQSAVDVDRLVTVFERFPLRAKKRRDLEVWLRAVACARAIPRGNRWKGAKDWTPLLELKAELERVRLYPEELH
jgi:hypothetical protein